MLRCTSYGCDCSFSNLAALYSHAVAKHLDNRALQTQARDCMSADTPLEAMPELSELPTTADFVPTLTDLAQREPDAVRRRTQTIVRRRPMSQMHKHDYSKAQDALIKYLREVENMFDPKWWAIFESVRLESAATQERALRAVKHSFHQVIDAKRFPTTRACFRNRVRQTLRDPVGRATRLTATIDMSSVGLPDIAFEFVDPIWVWVVQANRIGKREKLHFRSVVAENSQGARMYGCGVECGHAMEQGQLSGTCISDIS